MTVFAIKIIAIAAMIIDHIGFFFFPDILWFRMVGRISFPLFAWLIANGVYHTNSIRKYGERLFLFALLSQIPFLVAHKLYNPLFDPLNILFTLFLGLMAIVLIRDNNNRKIQIISVLVIAGLAAFLNVDYGAFGVFLIVFSYLFFHSLKLLFIVQTALYLIAYLLSSQLIMDQIQPIGLLALLIIAFYNGKLGFPAKYLFYIMYPLQYVIIYLVITLRG